MVKRKIIITITIIVLGVVLCEVFHIGKMARCSIISPTSEQISIMEEELGIDLSDNCTVSELLFTLDYSLWGWKNNTLSITVQPTDIDAFFNNNIPFELDHKLQGINQYEKSLSFSISDNNETVFITEKMTKNFSSCRDLFFQDAQIEWL